MFSMLAIIILAGSVVFLYYQVRKLRDEIRRLEKEMEVEHQFLKRSGGLNEYNEKMRQIKEERKQRILEMIGEKGKVKNRYVIKELDVSNATATRYLEELR